MTDKKQNDLFKTESGLNSEGDALDSDWESAFQAEDYLLNPEDDAGSLFSLEDDEDTVAAVEGSADRGKSGAAGVTAPGKNKKAAAAGRQQGSLLVRLGNWNGFSVLAGLLPESLKRKVDGNSPALRGAFLCISVFLVTTSLVAGLFWPGGKDVVVRPGSDPVEEAAAPAVPPESAQVTAGSPGASSGEDGQGGEGPGVIDPAVLPAIGPDALQEPELDGAPVEPSMVVMPESEVDAPAVAGTEDYPEFERKKWRFSSFMISPEPEQEGDVRHYVVVDLTLVLRQPFGEELPRNQQYVIRDMIYQFYSNRPFYELRRFSLARGEMKQKLKAWLRKQWPDNTVENIYFHRYKIL